MGRTSILSIRPARSRPAYLKWMSRTGSREDQKSLAIELKAVMTEHRKAIKNRKRDLEAHHEQIHNYDSRAIAGGVMLFNIAERFDLRTRRDDALMDWVIARLFRRYFGIRSAGRPNQDRELWELARQPPLVVTSDASGMAFSISQTPSVVLSQGVAACPLVGDCTFGIASLAGEA